LSLAVPRTPVTAVDDAAAAAREGRLVVYPTETVYGLGADALDADAVAAVFDAKRRDRSEPVSMAVPSVDAALEHVRPSDRAERFMRALLPGPVTVVVERGPAVPDALTAGRDRVGVRVPDDETALALLEQTPPLTATSANVSGRPSARRPADVDPEIRDAAAVVLDAGETPGGGSTVVDPDAGEIIREGAAADGVRAYLDEH
jgi:L-threonylcarbamoyladenylate synthase